ncbi:MAG: acyltransferase [Croceibacterium sp.]
MTTFFGLKTESDKIRNLDFLRLVASVAIVFLHSHEFFYLNPALRQQAITDADGLALFVDLFFAISGFVMAFVYEGRIGAPRDYAGFMWRRIARLYPLHLVVLALNMVLWAVLLTRGASTTAPSFSPSCVAYNALLVQEYFDCGSTNEFNGVTWSISVEMGMYAILPILILIASRGLGWLLLASTLAIVAGTLLIAPGGEWLDTPHLARGLAGFTFGYLLFKAQHLIPDIPRSGAIVVVLAAVALTEMVFGAPQIVSLLTLVGLVIVAVSADRHERIHPIALRLSPLGQLTYSSYIWHRLFILAFLNVAADKLFHGNIPILVAMAVVTYMAIFVASYLGYFMIEVPARRALTNRIRKSPKGAPPPAPNADFAP